MPTERFEFTNANGETLAGRLERPVTDVRAVVLFAHCFTCSKNIKAATQVSRALSERRIAVLRFDFTGLGNSEGDFSNTNFSSNVEDLVAAGNALREHDLAPTLLVGHSLGGAAVIAAATHFPEVRGVATIGAPSDPGHVTHLLGAAREQIENEGCATVNLAGRPFQIKKQFVDDVTEASLQSHLAGLKKSFLIFHSPTDDTVDIDHARRLYEAAKHPKSFVTLDGADHLLSSPDDAEYVAGILSTWAVRTGATAPEPVVENDGGVTVSETGDGYTNLIRAGRHTFLGDEPASVGGADRGPNPYDFLLAALGTCTTMTLRIYANRKGWPLERVTAQVKHSRIHAKDCEECESEKGFIDRLEKVLTIEGDLDETQRARLVEIASRCPVHRTLLNEKQMITTEVDPT